MMTGIMRTPIAKLPAIPENPMPGSFMPHSLNPITIIWYAKMPSRIEGRPVMISAVVRRALANFEVDSARNSPAMMPIGIAKSAATPSMTSEPMIAFEIPPMSFGSISEGNWGTFVKKSMLHQWMPFCTREYKIAKSGTSARRSAKPQSPTIPLEMRMRRSSVFVAAR